MKVKYIILTACLLVLPRLLGAQNVSDLIIAEILAQPDSTGLLDDYGRRSGWIELYNTSTGTVSYGGCFLTDDRNNLKKSLIPPTDLRTKLGPRQSVVFFASGNGHDGTFYAGFDFLSELHILFYHDHELAHQFVSLVLKELMPLSCDLKLMLDARQLHSGWYYLT